MAGRQHSWTKIEQARIGAPVAKGRPGSGAIRRAPQTGAQRVASSKPRGPTARGFQEWHAGYERSGASLRIPLQTPSTPSFPPLTTISPPTPCTPNHLPRAPWLEKYALLERLSAVCSLPSRSRAHAACKDSSVCALLWQITHQLQITVLNHAWNQIMDGNNDQQG